MTLVVVATSSWEAPDVAAALVGRGARDVAPHAAGAGRILVYGQYVDELAASRVVAELRCAGWAAALRPDDDDPHLLAWQHRTQPVRVGDRLLVCLPWAECARQGTVVEIDPGAAFGAGTHPTTRLLLEALVTRQRGGEQVLDVGCGSGVLAIAAVRLGAASAIGIDVDPAAVAATRANAARNGVAAQVTPLLTPLVDLAGTFDIVLANIGLETLVALAPDLERHVAPGGWLGLSGISPAQIARLAAALPSLRSTATPQLDDWAAILAEG